MVTLDGTQGEGGGQILRSALSLSGVTGRPLHIWNIRGGRTKPGLLRQHLTCVEAVAEITDAKVKGAALGSRELQFIPRGIRAGEYRFAVESAGSACLVFQTVLPTGILLAPSFWSYRRTPALTALTSNMPKARGRAVKCWQSAIICARNSGNWASGCGCTMFTRTRMWTKFCR